MLPTTLADGTLVLHSDVLGLDLRLEEGTLRFYDSVGQKLLSHTEIEQALRAAEQARQAAEQARREAEERAVREEAARQAAEARIAELEARLRERHHT
jgi:multidrug resistance efflux pump